MVDRVPVVRRAAAINALLFVGGATADFASLSVFRSLLLSDVCIIAAGILALRGPFRQLHRAAIGVMRRNWRFAAVAVAALAYLLGTAISTALAGAPANGVDSWLLFAMLIVCLAPAVGIAVHNIDGAMMWLACGLVVGTLFGALGFIEAAISGAPLYGLRPEGPLGSDPFFLILVGSAILATHLSFQAAGQPVLAVLRNRGALVDIALLTACGIGLAVARFRAGWLAFVVIILLAAYLSYGRLRATLAAAAAIAGVVALSNALAVIPAGISDRLSASFSGDAPDIIARSEVVEILMPVWLEHPWGVGLNQSTAYLPAALVLGAVGYIHNVIGNALVEGGPLAAAGIAFLPVALVLLWLGERRRTDAPRSWEATWPLVAVVGVFVAAQFVPTLYPHAAWIAVGALFGVAARWGRASDHPQPEAHRPDPQIRRPPWSRRRDSTFGRHRHA